MTDDQKKFELSVLEAEILVTIDNIGWYAYLWFPIVYREVLNFGSDAPDEQVHAAFATLIRKGVLVVRVVHQYRCGDIPELNLAPGVGNCQRCREPRERFADTVRILRPGLTDRFE